MGTLSTNSLPWLPKAVMVANSSQSNSPLILQVTVREPIEATRDQVQQGFSVKRRETVRKRARERESERKKESERESERDHV